MMPSKLVAARSARIKGSKNAALASAARRLVAAGELAADLTRGELGAGPPEALLAAARQAVTLPVHRYTDAIGTEELRHAIARRIAARSGLPYEAANIAVTAGAKQALYNLMLAILDEGDEVIIPAPYWTSFPELVRVAGGVPVIVETRDDSYLLDVDRVARSLSPRTRAIILNSPHNPTGRIYPDHVLRAVFELARERDMFVVADVCYASYDFTGERRATWTELSAGYERFAIVDSFSKTWSIAGWRLGYLAAPREVLRVAQAIQTHTTSNANCVAQAACCAMLREGAEAFERAVYGHLRNNRDLTARMLMTEPRLRVGPLEGGFFAFVDVSQLLGRRHAGTVLEDVNSFCAHLLERTQVLVVPGDAFGDPGGARISFSGSTSELELGLRRFVEFAREID